MVTILLKRMLKKSQFLCNSELRVMHLYSPVQLDSDKKKKASSVADDFSCLAGSWASLHFAHFLPQTIHSCVFSLKPPVPLARTVSSVVKKKHTRDCFGVVLGTSDTIKYDPWRSV